MTPEQRDEFRVAMTNIGWEILNRPPHTHTVSPSRIPSNIHIPATTLIPSNTITVIPAYIPYLTIILSLARISSNTHMPSPALSSSNTYTVIPAHIP